MPQEQDNVLIELRIAVARLEEQVKLVNTKLDLAVVSREHMESKLAPLMENMNKGKGALAAATLMAGAIGATLATFFKYLFGAHG